MVSGIWKGLIPVISIICGYIWLGKQNRYLHSYIC